MRQPLYNGLLQSDLNAEGYRVTGLKGLIFSRRTAIYASHLDAMLDSDLENGGGTDDTAVLQAALDAIEDAGGGTFILDGPALVTGLDLGDDTDLIASGEGGLFLKNGSNRALLRNKSQSRGARLARNISIVGGIYNGNHAGQAHTGTNGTWVTGIALYGVVHPQIDNVTVRDARTFAIHIANSSDVFVKGRNEYLNTTTTTETTRDGLHFNGPCERINVDGWAGQSGDDFIALNADDGWGDMLITNELGPYVGRGAITDVSIRAVQMKDCYWGIRLLSKTERIDRVNISDVKGFTHGHWLTIDPFDPSSASVLQPGNVGTVTVNDIDVRKTGSSDSFTVREGLRTIIRGHIEQLKFNNWRWDNQVAGDNSPLLYAGLSVGDAVHAAGADIGLLEIKGLSVTDPTGCNRLSNTLLKIDGATVKHLVLRDVLWTRAASTPTATALLGIINSSTVSDLAMENVSVERADNLVSLIDASSALSAVRVCGLSVSTMNSLFYLDHTVPGGIMLSNFGVGDSVVPAHSGAGAAGTAIRGDGYLGKAVFSATGGVLTIIALTGKITGVVRNGEGDYTLNFPGTLISYAVTGAASDGCVISCHGAGPVSNSSVRIAVTAFDGTLTDPTFASVLLN